MARERSPWYSLGSQPKWHFLHSLVFILLASYCVVCLLASVSHTCSPTLTHSPSEQSLAEYILRPKLFLADPTCTVNRVGRFYLNKLSSGPEICL